MSTTSEGLTHFQRYMNRRQEVFGDSDLCIPQKKAVWRKNLTKGAWIDEALCFQFDSKHRTFNICQPRILFLELYSHIFTWLFKYWESVFVFFVLWPHSEIISFHICFITFLFHLARIMPWVVLKRICNFSFPLRFTMYTVLRR